MAEDYVSFEMKWSYQYSHITEQGMKRCYRCRNVKAPGRQCGSGIYLLYSNETEDVILYRSQLEHNCHLIKTKSIKTVNEETKIEIKELFDLGFKHKAIVEHLSKNNL